MRSTIPVHPARTAAERLARQLQRHGHAVAVLDEHPNQGERERAMDDLRRGRVQILVASEAAARSLDVAGTAHVVNFDVPQTPEDYVHRLGRGGRADPVGDAFTLMSPDEQADVANIERFLGRAIPRVLLPDFDYDMPARDLEAGRQLRRRRRGSAWVERRRCRRRGAAYLRFARTAGTNGATAIARKPATEPRKGSKTPKTVARANGKPRPGAHRAKTAGKTASPKRARLSARPRTRR